MLSSEEIRAWYGEAERRTGDIRTTASDEWRAAVALRGVLGAGSAAVLHAELQRHLDAGRRVIRIDAGGVTFVDSAVIQELVDVSERCHADRGSLILTNVPARVRRLVKLGGLEPRLLIDTACDSPSRRPA